MANAVKIRKLTPPQPPLTTFDPGAYLSELEFYETNSRITDEDRDGLAQFAHFLAFLALEAESEMWSASIVRRDTLAYRALKSHFGNLDGWEELNSDEAGCSYSELAGFLMQHYPPHPPT